MFNLLKKKETEPTVLAPCDGRIVPLEQVKDATFSQKMMGDGFAVMPAGEYIMCNINHSLVSCAGLYNDGK